MSVVGGGYHSLGIKQDGSIAAWGANWYDQCNVPSPNTDFTAAAAGYYYSLGLKQDGSISAWGDNGSGQCNIPSSNTGFIAVAAGAENSLGQKQDGSIVAWGPNNYDQCNVPSPNAGFIDIATYEFHSLGLKSDGSVVAWGANWYGQCNVPEPNIDFIALAAGEVHSLGLKQDSSIVAWGNNNYGQCNVPAPNTDFIAVAAGGSHSLGLKQSGSIMAWGRNDDGQCNVPSPNAGFIAVAGGAYHSLGLKLNGSIVAWGSNDYGQCNVPLPNTDFILIEAGAFHSLGLKSDGTIEAWGDNSHYQCNVPTDNSFISISAGVFHNLAIVPDISVLPMILEFDAPLNRPGQLSQHIAITNYGNDDLNWTITEDCNWLTVEPNFGTLAAYDSNDVTVTVDINGLGYGYYDCNLTVSDSNDLNDIQIVPVNLHIYLFAENELYVPQQYPTIQSAINAAVSLDTIVVDPGTYYENINFNGKSIKLTSISPRDWSVAAATVLDGNDVNSVVTFTGSEDANCVLSGFTITGGFTSERGGGICGNNSHAKITRCVIRDNYALLSGGGIAYFDGKISECIISENRAGGNGGGIAISNGSISNCVLCGNRSNYGGGVNNCGGPITNCTVVYNRAASSVGGIRKSSGTVKNCIVWGNSDSNGLGEPAQIDEQPISIDYCCIKDWSGSLPGVGNIANDPCFIDTGFWDANGTPGDVNDDFWVDGDYHLQSAAGRWDANSRSWTIDANTSVCIDAGDPNSDWCGELWPHGKRINMGAYGGTSQASMSLSTAGSYADFNCDDVVDFRDLWMLTEVWLAEEALLAEDINRNGFVDFADFAKFTLCW